MKKEELFTVENAKIAKISYMYYNGGTKGYIKDGDGIVYAEVVNVEVDLKSRTVRHHFMGADKKTYVVEGEAFMYSSPALYEQGCPIDKTKVLPGNIRTGDRSFDLGDFEWVVTDDATDTEPSYGYFRVWCLVNGEAVHVPAVIRSIKTSENDCYAWEISDADLPDRFWDRKESVYLNSEYKVIDDDGEEFTERGHNLRLALKPDQQAVIEELKAVFKKALDAGIGFVWDREYSGNVEAYDGNEVFSFGYEEEEYRNGSLVPFDRSIMLADTGISFYDYNSCDEYRFAMKQTPRQEKEWKKAHPDKN